MARTANTPPESGTPSQSKATRVKSEAPPQSKPASESAKAPLEIAEGFKRCTKTGEIFPATPEYFYRDKSTKDGLSPWSKAAEKAYNKAYYTGLKAAGATRKAAIEDAKKSKAFEAAMQTERVKRGTFRSKVLKDEAPAQSKTRTRRQTKTA